MSKCPEVARGGGGGWAPLELIDALALRLFVRRFQMPLEGVSFVKTLVTFEIVYAADPFLKNMTKIACLR